MDCQTARRVDADIAKFMAEAAKLRIEGDRMARESLWYPVVLGAALMAAAIGATASFFKLFLL